MAGRDREVADARYDESERGGSRRGNAWAEEGTRVIVCLRLPLVLGVVARESGSRMLVCLGMRRFVTVTVTDEPPL